MAESVERTVLLEQQLERDGIRARARENALIMERANAQHARIRVRSAPDRKSQAEAAHILGATDVERARSALLHQAEARQILGAGEQQRRRSEVEKAEERARSALLKAADVETGLAQIKHVIAGVDDLEQREKADKLAKELATQRAATAKNKEQASPSKQAKPLAMCIHVATCSTATAHRPVHVATIS
jgi:hypothetical protein